jgi:hypothetical protein
MTLRFPRVAVVVAALAAAACSSSSYERVVSVNPPDASLYINGEKVGKGDARPRDFDFAEVDRVCIQAVHPDYLPHIEWKTQKELGDLVRNNIPLKITLTERR